MEPLLLDFISQLPERVWLGVKFESTRYAIGTLGVFFGVWIILAPFIQNRRIRQKRAPKKMRTNQIKMELLNSFKTVCIFVALDIFIFDIGSKGAFKLYDDTGQYGHAYYWGSIALAIILHDTYFYWTHRAMHSSKLYRHFHMTHHKSHNPTPFTAYSFAAGEAVVEYAYVPIMLLVLPLHTGAMATVLMVMIFKNALAHSGYELFPRGSTRHWFLKHFTTNTHHDMHHERGTANFGFYFTWWDRIMGTEHAHYHERFDAVTAKKAKREPAALTPAA